MFSLCPTLSRTTPAIHVLVPPLRTHIPLKVPKAALYITKPFYASHRLQVPRDIRGREHTQKERQELEGLRRDNEDLYEWVRKNQKSKRQSLTKEQFDEGKVGDESFKTEKAQYREDFLRGYIKALEEEHTEEVELNTQHGLGGDTKEALGQIEQEEAEKKEEEEFDAALEAACKEMAAEDVGFRQRTREDIIRLKRLVQALRKRDAEFREAKNWLEETASQVADLNTETDGFAEDIGKLKDDQKETIRIGIKLKRENQMLKERVKNLETMEEWLMYIVFGSFILSAVVFYNVDEKGKFIWRKKPEGSADVDTKVAEDQAKKDEMSKSWHWW